MTKKKLKYKSGITADSDLWYVRAAVALCNEDFLASPRAMTRSARAYIAARVASVMSEAFDIGAEHGDPNKRWPKP